VPRTLEDLRRSGATERKKHEPTIQQVREARRRYLEWQRHRRELFGERQDDYAYRFLDVSR
jgi:hypothetical protein